MAEIQSRIIVGSSTTGWNRHFGAPIADFPGGVGTFGFRTISKYNASGEAIPITGPLPASTMIASYLDPEWVNTLGFPPEVLNIAQSNIPHREIPIRVDVGGVNKESLTELRKQGQLDFGLASPTYPVTLGDWLRARGEMNITCYNNRYAYVQAQFSGLFPNHVYTLREWFRPGTEFLAVPGVFGGAPASFIADKYGNGSYSILLPVCPPMSEEQVEHPLFAVALTVNFAHEGGGLVPVFPLNANDPSFPGERAFGQLFFPLTGKRIVPGSGLVSDIRDWSCKTFKMLNSNLIMTSPSSSAIGQAEVMVDGETKFVDTRIDFTRLPEAQSDGSQKFLATLRHDLGQGDILDIFIEGTFLPTTNQLIFENNSVGRFVGGEGRFSTVIGDISFGGEANFEILVANITGEGEICSDGGQTAQKYAKH